MGFVFLIIAVTTIQQYSISDMTERIYTKIEKWESEFDRIPELRKEKIRELADVLIHEISSSDSANVTFICTHNSRRSQLSELWMEVASTYYGIDRHISAYSGGTEATAFNYRMVEALKRFGFEFQKEGTENPTYTLQNIAKENHIYFSKKYTHPSNPQSDFVAVMVCSDADDNCPIVYGSKSRFSLTFIDPKHADGTEKEAQIYDEKVEEIGREIVYLNHLLAKSLKA